MTLYHWLASVLSLLALAFLFLGGYMAIRRQRRLRTPPRKGWLTDAMVRQIIERGTLNERHVPEGGLDLEQIAREEERFWSETWDEPEHNWE